jgi:lysozyme family protein
MNWPTDNSGIVLMILSTEGGYVNNPDDCGGPTNMGVTIDQLASFRKAPVTAPDIKNLTVQEASALYLQKFIVGPNFDQLTSVNLRAAITDYGVLFGPLRAIQSLQTILGLTTDGILGPMSLAAANIAPAQSLINQLSIARVNAHINRVLTDNSQLQFLKGWTTRALQFIQ